MTIYFLTNLVLAALFSALLYVILKYFNTWKVNNLHGLTFNYLTAAIISFGIRFEENLSLVDESHEFLPYAFLIGALFITVFYIAALTAQKVGVTITSIAGKMSMIIPITAGIILYNDKVNLLRISGMVVAICAVVMSSYRNEKNGELSATHSRLLWLLPLLLFIGSGMVDTCIKISEHFLMNGENDDLFVAFLFGSAGVIGVALTLINLIRKGLRIEIRSMAAGILLGTLNYFSILFLMRVLGSQGAESSVVFALSNVLVVLFSTLFAILLFREKLSRINILGILLAITSILILSR